MDQNKIIRAIGENEPNDYILSTQEHIKLYEKSVPFLTKLLSKSEIHYYAVEYERRGTEARTAQSKFKKFSALGRWFVFLTAAFSTTLVISGSISGFQFFKTHLVWFPSFLMLFSTVATIFFSAISTSIIMIVKNGKLLEKWKGNRAEAEEIRLKYFKRIAEDKDINSPVEYLTVLEYFRRYQLDVQIGFFDVRSTQLEKKADTALYVIAILAALVLIINGISGVMGLQWTWIASLAIVVQSYSFMVNNKELTDQNANNSERYSKIRAELSLLKSQIDDVRRGILKKEQTVLMNYIKAVHELLSNEHRQWLKSMSSAGSALEGLAKQLKKFKDPGKDEEMNDKRNSEFDNEPEIIQETGEIETVEEALEETVVEEAEIETSIEPENEPEEQQNIEKSLEGAKNEEDVKG